MPRTCSICTHFERGEVEAALLAGEALRDIAGRFAVSRSALSRHHAEHLPAHLTKAHDAAQAADADDLLGQVRHLQSKALAILGKAEDSGDLKIALAAIREARGNLELLGKLAGELQENTVTVYTSPEWIELRSALLAALEPYPEARWAITKVVN